ncbi:MAG: membrane protein insertase YidC [Deltaproteobacteria bacterium]|nr:membrane protein insertase YidC [Deltaproteobacteria bacterium]MBW2660793.1 membrane protein insertase YidC [Deltaproteobacteria bacterium]
MDNPRFLIAITLSFLVFVLWQMFGVDKEQVQHIQQNQQIIEQPATPIIEQKPFIKEITQDKSLTQQEKAARIITVNTPLYSVQISEKGAVFKSFILKNYKENANPDSPLFEMISSEISETRVVGLGLDKNSIPGLERAVFSAKPVSDSININDTEKEIIFSWVSPQGITVEKRFTFLPETYLIGLNVVIKNGSDRIIQDRPVLSLMKPPPGEPGRYGFEGPSALIDKKLKQIKLKKLKDKNIFTGELRWIAVQDRYFMSSIIPVSAVDASMRLLLDKNNVLEAQYLGPASLIQPADQHVFEYKLFFGPKSTKVLKGLDYDLSKSIDFGIFNFLAKPCLWFMNIIYDIIPNYGVAIILLTVFTKIILWPLGNKSYKSMAQMKKIQPLMMELREKYKNDKKTMNVEVMALYKTYKVNPVGGCLPMLIQMPVFFALYRMLYEAIELRHAPFFGWITDLSVPDRLFRFGFAIPFMHEPYGIPVLTIIMGGTMFLQQKLTPPMGDPAQAKMMMFMPLIFTVIFINFSSGLVLYWLINNMLSIAQQYYITKQFAK